MITHDFLTYQETVDRLGAPETVRQAILTWGLEAYVELNETISSRCNADILPNSGGTKFAFWRRSSRWLCVADPDIEYPSEDDYEEEVYYTLSGWFMMRPPDAITIARSPACDVRLVLYLAPAQDDNEGYGGFFTPEHFEIDYVTRLEKLWFRRASVVHLASSESTEGTTDSTPQDSLSASSELAGGNIARNTSKVRESRILTYMPIIRALQEMAKVSRPEDAQRVIETLGLLGYHKLDAEMAGRVLRAARGFTMERNEKAKDEKPNPCEFERSIYLPIIHSLVMLAGVHRRGAVSSILSQLDQLTFNSPKDTNIRTILKEARGFVVAAQMNR